MASCVKDSGSDGVCAHAALTRFFNVNLSDLFDFSHNGMRVLDAALVKSGLKPHQKLMSTAYNAKHGPWHEAIRWSQGFEATQNHLRLMKPCDSPLFLQRLPGILRDRGRLHDASAPGIEEEMWQLWLDSWRAKGSWITDVRFMGSIREAKFQDPNWNCQGLGFLMACLSLDMLHGKSFEAMFAPGAKSSGPVALVAPEVGGSGAGSSADGTMKAAQQAKEGKVRTICMRLFVLGCNDVRLGREPGPTAHDCSELRASLLVAQRTQHRVARCARHNYVVNQTAQRQPDERPL